MGLRQTIRTHVVRVLQDALAPSVDRAVTGPIAQQISAAVARHVDTNWRRYLALRLLQDNPGATDQLSSFECRVFSQNGEDGVLIELCRRVGAPRSFVEFGAGNGREGNCVYLADVCAWGGLFIEADDTQAKSLHAKYAGIPAVTTVHAKVTTANVDELFRAASVPRDLGVLSIDVDGNDYWIWQAIASVSPSIVVIEYNGSLDPTSKVVRPYDEDAVWDQTTSFGASIGALCDLADTKGYELVYTDLTGTNAFFVRRDVVGDLPVGDAVARRAANYLFQDRGHPPGDGTFVVLG